MPTKKTTIDSEWVDPDDAPHLDAEWFDRAQISIGGKVIREARPYGRPKLDAPKQAVSLRLDPDVLEHFRASGPGWQSRINNLLRKAAGL